MAAYTRYIYTGDGVTNNPHTFGFTYEAQSHVVVTVDGVVQTQGTDYSFNSTTQITMTSAVADGSTLVIKRDTSQDTRLVTFTAGTLTSTDLNSSTQQVFNMAQESLDATLSKDGLDLWDALSTRITNVGTPTASADAATKLYVDNAALGVTGSTVTLPESVVIESTNAGATVNPVLDLHRNSASPADSDAIGQIIFSGEDDGSTKTTYAYIAGEIDDVTDTTEDGSLYVWNNIAGTVTHQAKIGGTQNNFLNDVYIGNATTAPSATLHVYDDTVSATVIIENTEAGTGANPTLRLWRNSASPASADDLGRLEFEGEDDGGTRTTYGRIQAELVDVASPNEDGGLYFAVNDAGTVTNKIFIDNDQINLNNNTYIGSASTTPSAPLHVYDTVAGVDTVLIESTDAGATGGPILSLWRNSSSPAAGDSLAFIHFAGEDAGGVLTNYASISSTIKATTGGSEDAVLVIRALEANVQKDMRWGTDTATEGVSLYIPNVGASGAPATNPSAGGLLYVESGALKYRGSSGTVTTLGTA